MTGQLTVWHGTELECAELMAAMQHSGVTVAEARELLGDQRVIDRLLFVRRKRALWTDFPTESHTSEGSAEP